VILYKIKKFQNISATHNATWKQKLVGGIFFLILRIKIKLQNHLKKFGFEVYFGFRFAFWQTAIELHVLDTNAGKQLP
jgi:hypothetical protein